MTDAVVQGLSTLQHRRYPAGFFHFFRYTLASFASLIFQSFFFSLFALSLSAAPPRFVNCPSDTMRRSHCNTFYFDFDATNPDGGTLTYQLLAGPGIMNAQTGVWFWAYASEADVANSPIEVSVRASAAGGADSCTFTLIVTNEAPQLRSGCFTIDETYFGGPGISRGFSHVDDCGSAVYSLGVVSPGFVGSTILDPSTGRIYIFPAATDYLLPQPVEFRIRVTDQAGAADSCAYFVHVVSVPTIKIRADSVAYTYQPGRQYFEVPLILHTSDSVAELGGLDLVLIFDSTLLKLDSILPGSLIDSCKWDYFTYRQYPQDSCSDLGTTAIRIDALKWLYYPYRLPKCPNPGANSVSIARLKFHVESDICEDPSRNIPLRFYWLDCGDNIVSAWDANATLFYAKDVIESQGYSSSGHSIFDKDKESPSITGPQQSCLDSVPYLHNRFQSAVAFYNGTISVGGGDCIDVTGDINLNGISYELADLVMFADFFSEGLSAFGTHIPGSILVSDVNRDGTLLSVSDLVYLLRIVIGDEVRTDVSTSIFPPENEK